MVCEAFTSLQSSEAALVRVCGQVYRNVNVVYERRRREDGDGSLGVTEQSFK